MAMEDYLEPGVSPWAVAAMRDIPMDDDLDDAPSCWICGDDDFRPDGRPCDHRDPRRTRHVRPEHCAMQPEPYRPPVPAGPDPRTVDDTPAPF